MIKVGPSYKHLLHLMLCIDYLKNNKHWCTAYLPITFRNEKGNLLLDILQ